MIYIKSQSHPATKQDLWVLSVFGNLKPNGSQVCSMGRTFCELGAFDGITHSNTKLLENYAWRGTLIEAHEPFHKLCAYNRPGAECIHAAIGDGSPKTLVVGGQYTGLLECMPLEWQVEHHRRGNQIFTVETEPLINYVQKVDYLSLDTEGGEYEILKNWLESGGQATAITVEFRYETELLHKLERLGNDHGYVLDEVRGFDLCLLKS